MPYCKNCGAQVPETAKFCKSCGNAQPEPAIASVQSVQTENTQSAVAVLPTTNLTYTPEATNTPQVYTGTALPRAQLKVAAKQQLQGNVGTMFLCMLVMGLIMSFTFGLGVIAAPMMGLGICSIYFAFMNGQSASVGDMFCHSKLFGRALWLMIVQNFFVFLWSLLLFVPGIIKAISYSFAAFALADNPNLTAREALNESKRITKGHIGELFVLRLSFFPWYLLSIVTLGFSMIHTLPYIGLTNAHVYRHLKTLAEGAQTV